MEEKRHDRELKFRLEMRREEREHELRVLQMMMQTRRLTLNGQLQDSWNLNIVLVDKLITIFNFESKLQMKKEHIPRGGSKLNVV